MSQIRLLLSRHISKTDTREDQNELGALVYSKYRHFFLAFVAVLKVNPTTVLIVTRLTKDQYHVRLRWLGALEEADGIE